MNYHRIKKEDFEEWFRMRRMLWPKHSKKELRSEGKKILATKNQRDMADLVLDGLVSVEDNAKNAVNLIKTYFPNSKY